MKMNKLISRVEQLRLLKDGWLDGYGTALNQDGLTWFVEHFPIELSLPYLYPTAEGGLRVEWSNIDSEMSLDINLSTKSAIWHKLCYTKDKTETEILNLNESWQRLIVLVNGDKTFND